METQPNIAEIEKKSLTETLLKNAKISDPTPEQILFLERASEGMTVEPSTLSELTNGYVLWYCDQQGLKPVFSEEDENLQINVALKENGDVVEEVHGFKTALDPNKMLTFGRDDDRYGENMIIRKLFSYAMLAKDKILERHLKTKKDLFGKYLAPITVFGDDGKDIIKEGNRHILISRDFQQRRDALSLIPKSCNFHEIPFTYEELQMMIDPTREKRAVDKVRGESVYPSIEPIRHVDSSRVAVFIEEMGVSLEGIDPSQLETTGVASMAGQLFERIVAKEMEEASFKDRLVKYFDPDINLFDLQSVHSTALNEAFEIFAYNTRTMFPDKVLVGMRNGVMVIPAVIEIKGGSLSKVKNDQLQRFIDSVNNFVKAVNKKITISQGKGALIRGRLKLHQLSVDNSLKVIMVRPLETPDDDTEQKRGLEEGRTPVHIIESKFTREEIQSYIYDEYLRTKK